MTISICTNCGKQVTSLIYNKARYGKAGLCKVCALRKWGGVGSNKVKDRQRCSNCHMRKTRMQVNCQHCGAI